jgi:hypothetical protein
MGAIGKQTLRSLPAALDEELRQRLVPSGCRLIEQGPILRVDSKV